MARALAKPVGDAAPTELEIKLRLPPGAESALEGHPALQPPGAGAAELREETTTYFDTPGWDLSGAGASLRIRRSAGRRVQTLKLRGGLGSPFGRGEWEWPVEGDVPDLARLAEAPAVAPPGVLQQLAPVFATEVSRRVRLLPLDGALVELALDTGTIRAGGQAAEIREMELELKAGAPGPMYRLAAALQAEVPLTLGVESKAERGWRLCTGKPRAPQKQADVALPDGITSAEALRRILGATLANLLANLPAAAAGGMGGVHNMRIAIRRLRAVLSLFRPALDPQPLRRLTAELRRLGQVLGEARDWDVFCGQTLAKLATDGVDPACLEALRGPAEAERAAAHRRLATELEGPALTATVLGLAAWAESPALMSGEADGGTLTLPLADLAPRLEARLERKALRRGKRLRRRSEEELHELRKALKKLRYGVEFLAPLHRRKRVKAYLEACKALQEGLGAFNDAAVAVALADRLGSGGRRAELAPAVAALAGWAGTRRESARRHLHRDWRAFKAVPLPR